MADINKVRTDVDKELNGVWIPFAEGIQLKIARAGNSKYNEMLRRLSAPHLEKIRDRSIDEEEYAVILKQVRAETILLDWSNIEESGRSITYTPTKALEYFMDPSLKDFYNFTIIQSQNIDLFRKDIIETGIKNQ